MAPAPSGVSPLSSENGRNTRYEPKRGSVVPIHKQAGFAYLLQYNQVLGKGGDARANYVEATEIAE